MKDTRTYADRRQELIKAVAKRRRKIKELSIRYKGGKCQICGYAKYQGALDLHHRFQILKYLESVIRVTRALGKG